MIKIPDTIKISGHIWKIKKLDDRAKETGADAPASMMSKYNTIWLDMSDTQTRIESNLLHEIIEALNYDFGWNLEHRVISQLEAGLYQVLKDNNLLNEFIKR